MNSEGEKIPPEDPEPRLTVAVTQQQEPPADQFAEQGRLDRRVPLRCSSALLQPPGRTSVARPAACRRMPNIGAWDSLEDVLAPVQRAHK
jgi:hypothetical protein